MESINKRWERLASNEYLLFSEIKEKFSHRADVHAFILLDRLFPAQKGKQFDLISATEHDEIYLDISTEQIEKLSDEKIIELSRCGVRYSNEFGCLCMFL